MEFIISEEKIAEWKRLAEAATPGPWEVIPDIRPDIVQPDLREIWTMSKEGGYEDEGQIVRAFHRYPGHILELAKNYGRPNSIGSAGDDAEFIATSREAVPALLAEREQLLIEIRERDESNALFEKVVMSSVKHNEELRLVLVGARAFVLAVHPGDDMDLALKREQMIEKIDRLTGFPTQEPA